MPHLQKFLRFLDLDRKTHVLTQACIFRLLSGEDFHPGQLPILWAISQTSHTTQGQIARILGVSRAAVAVSAKRMEHTGLVCREKAPMTSAVPWSPLPPRAGKWPGRPDPFRRRSSPAA